MNHKNWRDKEYLCRECGTYGDAATGMDTMPSECTSCSNSGPYTIREECNDFTVGLLRKIFTLEKECSYEQKKLCEKLRNAFNVSAARFHDSSSYDEKKFKEVELNAFAYLTALQKLL